MTSGIRGTGHDEWTQVIVRFGEILPRYPDASLIKPPRTPPPPLLQGDTPEARALELLRAYKSVTSFYFGIRPGKHYSKLRIRDLATEVRHVKPLIASAEFFYERQVRPHVWISLSVREWRRYGPPRMRHRAPAMQWVFSRARYEKFEFLYVDAEESARLGGHIAFTKSHVELIKLYEKLRIQLVHASAALGGKLRKRHVENAVDEVLPNRVYRMLVSRARREAEERQAVIDDAYEQGSFLWG